MRIKLESYRRLIVGRQADVETAMRAVTSDYGDGWVEVDHRHPGYPPSKVTAQPTESLPHRGSVGWLEKAKNFAVASAKHVAAGMPTCSEEEIIRRHDICMGCEFFNDNSCGKCGCPIARDKKFISKLAWADQSCPVGKWGPT